VTAIGVSGHQSIPASVRAVIASEIDAYLARSVASSYGICSLAAGVDQMFASAVLRSGRSIHVVVPSKEYETTFSDSVDRGEYHRLLGSAVFVEELAFESPSEEAFLAAGRRVVDLCDVLLAVWDGKQARGLGGTADIVEYARDLDREILVIWPAGAER
jgi:hypothetical protein